MHDEQHRKRQMAVDERIIQERRSIVIKHSTKLRKVLGYVKVDEPFLAPPPLSSADTVSPPIVPSATAFQEGPQSLSTTTASTEWAPTAADLGKDEPTPLLSEAAASMTELMGNDFLPHPSTHSKEQSNVHSSSKEHSGHHAPAGPAKRKYHPDLLTFTFPAAPPSEDMTEFQMSDSVSTAGDDPQAFRDASTPAPSFSPQSAASSEFNIWEDKDDVDAEGEYCESEQETVQNNVISDVSLKHKGTSGKDGNTSQSLPQYHPAPQPARQPATQCNVVPNLEDVFDQWFRFGRKNWEGLRLLEPREIPIESITARTVPCFEPYVPKELREKPVKLFTIAAKHDAAEIKMFEVEVLPESEMARKPLFKLNDRGTYHETSTVNSNVWTVLFIREKAPRFMGYGFKGSGKPEEDETGTGVHVAKKIRRGQGPDVEEAPMLGEDSTHHSWQIVAWPSVHTSRVLEVLGPVRGNKMEEMDNSKAPQGKAAATGRPPLAPKITQVGQTPPPQGTGRVHLKDAQAYTEYKTTARARAEMKQQFAGDGVFEDGENSPFPLQDPFCFKVVDAIKGHVTKKSAGMSGLTINDDGGDHNSVPVREMQRFTCLRFQRGGTYPLLTGKGVDLNYWNTFCEYFCKGEVQLEVFSPADGEPVALSEEEQQRRQSTGPSDTLSQGATKINHAHRASDSRVGAFRTGGRTSDTPIPEPMRSAMEYNRVDQPDSTPLLQRQNTPYGTQNAPPQHGTRDRRFQSNAQNTQRHKSLHELPLVIKPSLHPQHSRVNSDSDGGFTVRPQHRDHHRDTSAESIKVFADADADADADAPTDTPTAKRQPFGRAFGDGPSRTDPLLHGWQMEMLDALGNRRSPAWAGWTDRSINHDKRMRQIEVNSARIAEEAFYCPSKLVRVLHDDRALRDGNVMVRHYEAEAERRHADYENLKKLSWYRQQVADDDEGLRKREQHFQPLEYMEDVRSKATQRECEKGRMSPSAGLRVLRNTLRVGESQKLEELRQQQQEEHQRRQEEHRKLIQQQLQEQSRLQALGAYGGQDRTYGSHHQQHRQQAQHVPGSYGQSFAPSTFSYGGAPQQQERHSATVGGHGYHHATLIKASSVPPNMTYAQHGPYRGPSQTTYGRVQQQHIGQNFNGQIDAPLPPVTQQQERAPSAAAAAAAGPSYFVWGHVPSAIAAAAEETRANDGKAIKSSWAAVEDEDDDDSEDDYFENGWY